MCMDDNADAKRILLASPPADWRRQLGRPRITWLSTIQQDLKHHYLTLLEASDLAQNSVEDVDVWRYAIVSCMPEMTTTKKRKRSVLDLETKVTIINDNGQAINSPLSVLHETLLSKPSAHLARSITDFEHNGHFWMVPKSLFYCIINNHILVQFNNWCHLHKAL